MMHLSWFAPFYSGGGYCTEAQAIIASLHVHNQASSSSFSSSRGNLSFGLSHHGDSVHSEYLNNGLSQNEKNLYSLYDEFSNPPTTRGGLGKTVYVSVCHSEPGAWYVPRPKYHTTPCPPDRSDYNIGRTMFETDTIPSGWVDRLNYMDEVWVPTYFSREVFAANGVHMDKLRVVEEAVDTTFFTYSNRSLVRGGEPDPISNGRLHLPRDLKALKMLEPSTFVYLFVGKYETRKGIDILLRAYFKEFSSTFDNVLLVFLTSAYHSSNDFEQKIGDTINKENLDGPQKPPYIILSGIKQTSLKILYSLIDVLVIPSRGEGWGRPHMEAMATGRPVIATYWSGPTAYLTQENGYPLRIEGLIDAEGWSGHKWAQPDLTHLRNLLRHVYENQEEVSKKGIVARSDVERRFSLSVMGDTLAAEFERIQSIMHKKRAKATGIGEF